MTYNSDMTYNRKERVGAAHGFFDFEVNLYQ